jgi:hypothetical protein
MNRNKANGKTNEKRQYCLDKKKRNREEKNLGKARERERKKKERKEKDHINKQES